MAIIKTFLTISLLLVICQDVSLQDSKEINNKVIENKENLFRLPDFIVPMHYDVKLIVHIAGNFTTNGETSIDIKVRKPTHIIALHTNKLSINESLTKIIRKDVNDENSTLEYIPKQHEYNTLTQILTLQFEELLDVGSYILYINFTGIILDASILNRNGFYKSSYIDDKKNEIKLAVTHFQPIYARQAFPCWDEPALKATFKFSIKHYPNYTALSNMPSTRSEIDPADGKLWTYFETTSIMSTHILGFVISDYHYISNLDGTVKIWGPKHLLSNASYSLDMIEKATQEMKKYINSTFRVPKMDHVSIRNYFSRGTEHWGMISYEEFVLLGDNSMNDITYHKKSDVITITHELAHQWFGNLVSPIWWKYVWLSEGISTYLGYYITNKFLKGKRVMDYFVVNVKQDILQKDIYSTMPIHKNITGDKNVYYEAFNFKTYRKAAFLMRMASHFLTEDVFRNGLIRYIQQHEYSSTTPDDLWKALQDALDESDVPHNNLKVKEVMDTWFEQPNYPIVTVNRDYTTGEIKISQNVCTNERFNHTGKAWWIPINFITQSDLNFSSTLPTHWLKPYEENLIIEGVDINNWIILDKNATGLYRVNYDINNWKQIAAFLNSDNYDKISILNRAQIVSDAYYMKNNEMLDEVTYIEIISYLSQETDIAPWYAASNILDEFERYLKSSEGAMIFKPYLFNLMHKILEKIDLENNDDDLLTPFVKTKLYNLDCKYDLFKCRTNITTKLFACIKNSTVNQSSLFEKQILCYGLIKMNESMWDQFLQINQEMFNTYLGCSENLHVIEKHLNLLNNKTLIYTFFNNLPNVDTAIEVFINNYNKFSELDSILYDIIMKSNEDQINQIQTFAVQHAIDIQYYLQDREKMLIKMQNYLSKISSILKNK